MTSAGDRYIPDLAACLAGEVKVFSWQATYEALTDNARSPHPFLIDTLITSRKIKNILDQTVPTFPSPSEQARTQLETRTAAINVTPSRTANYDVENIKADASWLSSEVRLNEEESLRIVLLEWQLQPAQNLSEGYSDAELASMRNALGSQDTLAARGIDPIFTKRNDGVPKTASRTRHRLLELYFQEQIALLAASRHLLELVLCEGLIHPTNLSQFANDLYLTSGNTTDINVVVSAIQSRLQALEKGKAWPAEIEDLNDRWVASELQCILSLQEILLVRRFFSGRSTAYDTHITTDTVLCWLRLMAGCEFFANVQPGPLLLPPQVESLQAITALTTLTMLDLHRTMSTLREVSSSPDASIYFLNGDAAHDINEIFLLAAEANIRSATPSSLAWAFIIGKIKFLAMDSREARESGAVARAIDHVATHDTATGRRTSSSSFSQSIYEEVMNNITSTSDISDPASYLLRCTTEAADVFETIAVLTKKSNYRSPTIAHLSLRELQHLLLYATNLVGYSPDILSSQIALLSSDLGREVGMAPLTDNFLSNTWCKEHILGVAAARFPYEALPFLRLCKPLASAEEFNDQGIQYIAHKLRNMESYTQSAVGAFALYHTYREDENLNLVELDTSASILQGTQQRLLTNQRDISDFDIIPSDTKGEVISDSIPPIIKWSYSYSALALLGVWVDLYYVGQLQIILQHHESAAEVVTEVIGIITALLNSTMTDSPQFPSSLGEIDRRRLQDELLDDASSELQSDWNIADYIFEILEQELQAYRRRPSTTFDTTVLVACVDFASVFSTIKPQQFWASFSKSSLLDSYGSDSFLLSIVSGVEIPNQRFVFLHSCTKLFENVIEAVCQYTRFGDTRSNPSSFAKLQPQTARVHSKVLASITQALYAAFEAIPGWSFASHDERNEIIALLASCFRKTVIYANGLEQFDSSLTSSFAQASNFIAQQMRLSLDDISSTSCVIRHLLQLQETCGLLESSSPTREQQLALEALLSLSLTLVQLGKLRSEPPAALDRQLLNAIPLLCRAFTHAGQKTAIDLVHSLLDIVAGDRAGAGPVSLLGHLGSTSAINFLEVLKLNTGPWADESLRPSAWQLLSSLVRKDQQWSAIVILTGSPPEKGRSNEHGHISQTMRGKPLLDQALKTLAKITELRPSVAISIIDFVIRAQMNWSWANETMKSDRDFLPSILSYVCNTFVDVNDELKISYRNRIGASVTDLVTLHLHHSKASRDESALQTILPLLQWLSREAILVASYRHSLHANLRKNFATKFGGLELKNLKKTGLLKSAYGEDYYYDLTFAKKILNQEPQWNGNDRFRDQSFSAEFGRANLNLSVVDSEVRLLNSALNLCIEHSGYFVQNAGARNSSIEMVKNCLEANTRAHPTEKLFENILQSRADMAIALLQRLVDVRATGPEVRALLKYAWECARFNNGSFEQAIADNNITYWRSMMTTLLLALQFQVDKRYMPPAADARPSALLRHTENAIPIILEVTSVVVGQGFRYIAGSLQDQKHAGTLVESSSSNVISYKDVHLVLTIFETILRMTRLPEFVSEASHRLIAEGAVQSCLLLYSWSHILTVPELDDEPIHADYALRFLVLLSSLPPVAEELAVEGVFSRLISARMTQKLQSIPDGAGHFDKRPHTQLLYNLWATGFLPVCLNMLESVGGPVASEVSVFLNQFAKQLNRASVAFIPSQSRSASAYAITSTVANEATTLALISFILGSFRNAGASAAVDPSSIQPLLGYDNHKKALFGDIQDIVNATTESLKNKVVAVSEKELTLMRENKGEGLVKAIVTELQKALICLKQEDSEEVK